MSKSPESHWAMYSGGLSSLVEGIQIMIKETKLADPKSKDLLSEGLFGVAVTFESGNCNH